MQTAKELSPRGAVDSRSLGRIKMSAENILLLILVGHNMKEKMSNNI